MHEELLSALNVVGEQGDEVKANCPYHGGSDSMFVNLAKGVFYCHACGEMGTLSKLAKKLGVKLRSKAKAPSDEEVEHVRKYIPEDELQAASARLWSAEGEDLRHYLLTKRGVADGLCRDLGLGLGPDNRLWIPVRDERGCFNVRGYDWLKVSEKKVTHYAPGYGEDVLLGDISGPVVTMLEGEPDWLCALAMGAPCPVTNTGGASNWKPGFTQLLAGKTINICLDNDAAGRKGAALRSRQLRLAGCKVNVIEVPKTCGKDFTDWALSQAFDRTAVMSLFTHAEGELQSVELANSGQLYGQQAKMRGVISGKLVSPFLVPTRVEILCSFDAKNKLCKGCPAAAFEGKGSVDLRGDHDTAVRCVDVNEEQLNKVLFNRFALPRGCQGHQFSVTETRELIEVRLVNDLEDGSSLDGVFGEHVVRQAYSYVPLQTSGSYVFEALSTKHPKTQQALLLVTAATGSQSALETWSVEGKEGILDFWRTH